MKTFIVLTFAFLGFAFYEMSGGADFEPASARMAQVTPVVVAEATQESTAPDASAIAPTPEVTRVALSLTTVSDTPQPAPVAAQPVAAPAQQAPVANDTAVVVTSADTPQIILPSLIATTPNATASSAFEDIRTVSGNRVNVRGGPSTDYGIVSKLTRGEEVRVIEDNGNGWVMIITPETGEEGWMADFLLTSG